MKSIIVVFVSLFVGLSAQAKSAGKYIYINAKVQCKDEGNDCRYNCELDEGAMWGAISKNAGASLCKTARKVDRGCPVHKVTNWHWITDRLVVMDFGSYHDMGCKVLSHARTNSYETTDDYGYTHSHVGKMHDAN